MGSLFSAQLRRRESITDRKPRMLYREAGAKSQCCELSAFRALRQEPKWEFQPLASAFADGEGLIIAFSRAVALARNIFPAICNLFPVAERAAKPSEGATFDSRCSRGRSRTKEHGAGHLRVASVELKQDALDVRWTDVAHHGDRVTRFRRTLDQKITCPAISSNRKSTRASANRRE
jgi:hypothetical protein